MSEIHSIGLGDCAFSNCQQRSLRAVPVVSATMTVESNVWLVATDSLRPPKCQVARSKSNSDEPQGSEAMFLLRGFQSF